MSLSDVNLTRRDPRGQLLRQLRRLVEGREPENISGSRLSTLDSRLSSGTAAIDRLLPGGGLRRGMLVEWVENSGVEEEWSRGVGQKNIGYSTPPLLHSSTSTTLSLLAAREACEPGGVLVLVDRQRTFYPPAAAAWGVDLQRLIVVRPASARDQLWAAVESLRSPAVAAVWMAIERIDDRAFRRLQLAAQAQRAVGLLVRPASAVGEPSWADVRLGVGARQGDKETSRRSAVAGRQGEKSTRAFSLSPGLPVSLSSSARRVHVRVLRCRQGRAGGAAWLEIDDVAHEVREVNANHDAHPLPVVAELADSAGARGAG